MKLEAKEMTKERMGHATDWFTQIDPRHTDNWFGVDLLKHVAFLEQQLGAERAAHEETKNTLFKSEQGFLKLGDELAQTKKALEEAVNRGAEAITEVARLNANCPHVARIAELERENAEKETRLDLYRDPMNTINKVVTERDRYKALLEARPKFYGWREFPHDVPYTEGNEENKRQFDEWNAAVDAAGVSRK